MSDNAVEFAAVGRRCVLVVEDEPLVRLSIAEALRELGVAVVEAASAEEAWKYLRTEEGIGVVFADNDLPGSLTGAALGAKVARAFPEISFILTSGRGEIDGWTGRFMPKPYDVAAAASALVEHAEAIGGDDRTGNDGQALHPPVGG